MKIFLLKPRGFCAGVVRAIQTVEKALSIWGPPIYVKHEIVHNQHVVNELKNKGVIFVEDLEEVPVSSRIIYSAHGVAPEIRQMAKKKKLFEIDATCGLVAKIHFAIKRYAKKGYKIILVGHKNHVEIIGAYKEAEKSTVVVQSKEEVNALDFPSNTKVFYVVQTTYSVDESKIIIEALKNKYPQIETLNSNSICFATTNRQEALKRISQDVDVILVIGDPKSSNSNRLKEIALKQNKKAYLVNSDEEIDCSFFTEQSSIAITAGASTPEYIVQKCLDKIKRFSPQANVEEIEYVKENMYFDLPKVMLDEAASIA